MKTAPTLQQFMVQVTEQHGVVIDQTGAYLRLDLADERLVIENIGAGRIRIACQLYLGHDWVSDPEIVLWTGDKVAWAPIEVNQVQGGWQCYAEVDATGDLVDSTDVHGQAALASFVEEVVAPNLKAQGWLERGIPPSAPRPVYTPEQMQERGYILMDLLPTESSDADGARMTGCQSTNHDHCYGELWQCAACLKTVCYAEGADDHRELCDDCWVKDQESLARDMMLPVADIPQEVVAAYVNARDGEWYSDEVESPDTPDLETLMQWMNEGVCLATDGCRVECDGRCEHGHQSWLLELGLI